jgi:hypothetical protein
MLMRVAVGIHHQDIDSAIEVRGRPDLFYTVNPLHGRENNVFTSRSTTCFRSFFYLVVLLSPYN